MGVSPHAIGRAVHDGRSMLLAADAALATGRRHHGAVRFIGIVVLVALVVAIVIIVRQRRATRTVHADPTTPAPPVATSPVTDVGATAHASASTRPAAVREDSARAASAAPQRPSPSSDDRRRRSLTATGPATIEVRHLTKRYGDKVAVDDLSFDVRPGHVTGFLGPNGAGKSTTMRVIMGLDAPDGGSVRINGASYHDLGWPLREIGALLEAKAIHPGRSAYAHLLMLAQTNRIPKRRVDEVLAQVGLTAVARQLAGGFSLGMGQRLGIAEALLGDPRILLFDEPMNGLDTDGIRWVRDLLRQLASEGRTVLVSSHLMGEMSLIADQVVVIGRGRLIAEMATDDFVTSNSEQFVRVRARELDRLTHALEAAGARVEAGDDSISVHGLDAEEIGALSLRESIVLSELAPQTASLEEAFIESTEGTLEFSVDRPAAAARPRDEQ